MLNENNNNENRRGGALETVMKKLIRPETWIGMHWTVKASAKVSSGNSQEYCDFAFT